MERIMRKVWGEWFPGDINIYLMPIVELRVLILIKVNLLCIRNDSGIFILSNVFTCLKDTKTLVPFMRSFFSFWFFGLEILFSLSIVYSKLGKNQCSLFSPYKYPVVTLFWENISFHHWKAFVYFWKIIWPIMFQSTSELYFFSFKKMLRCTLIYLHFHKNLRFIMSTSAKTCWNFDWDCIEIINLE